MFFKPAEHFSVHFGSQKDIKAYILTIFCALRCQQGHFGIFCQPLWHLRKCLGTSESTPAIDLAPMKALLRILGLHEGTVARLINQQGTLAYILASKRTLRHTFRLPRGHLASVWAPETTI